MLYDKSILTFQPNKHTTQHSLVVSGGDGSVQCAKVCIEYPSGI